MPAPATRSPKLDADGRYVDKLLEQALSEELTKSFWTRPPGDVGSNPPDQCRMTREEWESCSPGMRRAITREFAPTPTSVPPAPLPPLNEHEQTMRRVAAKARL